MSTDAPQRRLQPGSGSWVALTASELGAAHQAGGLPNQDSVAARQIGPDVLIAAVADGHGHHRHFRSARGSELAVSVACDAAEELAARLDGFGSADQVESEALSTLVPIITGRWRQAVAADVAANPFTDAEEVARDPDDEVQIAYGSTLLLAISRGKWLVLIQIGDGDVVGIRPDGRALLPVPGDPSLDGRQTTSLCGLHAEADFRAAVVDTTRTPLAGVLLATDGYGNAQVAEPWPEAVSADLAELIGARPPEWLAGQLPAWAKRCASADGSADDTTIALLIAPATARRVEEATVPVGDELSAAAARRLAASAGPGDTAPGEALAARERRLAKSAVTAPARSAPSAAPPHGSHGPLAAVPPGASADTAPVAGPAMMHAPPPSVMGAQPVTRPLGGPGASAGAAPPGGPGAPSGAVPYGAPGAPGGVPRHGGPGAPPRRRGRLLWLAVIILVLVLAVAAVAIALLRRGSSPAVRAAACHPPSSAIGKAVANSTAAVCDPSTGRYVKVSMNGLPSGARVMLQADNSVFVLVRDTLLWRPISGRALTWTALGRVPAGAQQGLCLSRGQVIVADASADGPTASWTQVSVPETSPVRLGRPAPAGGDVCAGGITR